MTRMVSSTPAISVTPAEPFNRFNVVDLESGGGGTLREDHDPVVPLASKNRFTVRNSCTIRMGYLVQTTNSGTDTGNIISIRSVVKIAKTATVNTDIPPSPSILTVRVRPFQVAPALVESEAKSINGEGQNGDSGGGSASDSSEDEVYSPEEDRANMSIVRFGTVDSRRISTDYYSYFTAPPGVSAGKQSDRRG